VVSISTRLRWDGSIAYSVRWREFGTQRQRRLTVGSEQEAISLFEHLQCHGRLPEPASSSGQPGPLTVAEVVQEHIDLLVRPASGAVATYQRMLDLHIRHAIGHIALEDFGYREIIRWIKGLSSKGIAPKSIHNMHGLLSAAMNTAERLQYITRNPCRGVPLPALDRVDDGARFLTPEEFFLLLDGMNRNYTAFVQFLVMTGTRFGEATAIQAADIDLTSRVPTARINKAWKRDGQSGYYLGPTKTGAGKRTIGINTSLANLLRPLLSDRTGTELVFTTAAGGRIGHKPFWQHHWVPAVQAAQTNGLTKSPRIHDLRHTHASWLIQDGAMPLFAISRRLGHASVRTTEQIYGHLMPQALQDGADATERSIQGFIHPSGRELMLRRNSPSGCPKNP
jgi:integrase